jgi:2-polyprenyl-3-methyl-5-hydroxy-6-metoxy-1,4-benzoquinol methylase
MALLSKYLSGARMARLTPYIKGDILDIGCQHGQLKTKVADQIRSYTGLDMSSAAVAAAKELHPDATFLTLNIDEEIIPFEDAFDTIVMSAVIEHIFNLRMLGQSLAKALRPGGVVVLTTPTPFGNDFVHSLGASIGLFSKIAADDHIAIFNRKRCEVFANEFGLRLTRHRLFQLGCNQLAIIEKPAPGALAA